MAPWSDPAHIHPESQRCEAGQPTKPVHCGAHDEHRWCAVCQGWFDLYHVTHVPAVTLAAMNRLMGSAA